jgi:hypothetical protein
VLQIGADNSTTTIEGQVFKYTYDALGRRIVEGSSHATGGYVSPPDVDLYFSAAWQVIEELSVDITDPDVTTTTLVENTWRPAYIDAMIERDVTITVDGLGDGPEGGFQMDTSGTPGTPRPIRDLLCYNEQYV